MSAISNEIYIASIKIIPDILWVGFAVALLAVFRRPLYSLIPYIREVKLAGVECTFVQEGIRAAVDLAKKHPKWKVEVTSEQARIVMDRASHHQELLKGTRILWVDDVPENNRNEIKMFHQLQVDIDTATSTEEAVEKILSQSYDLVISDMKRDDISDMKRDDISDMKRDDISDMKRDDPREAGVVMLERFRSQGIEYPVIFYVGELNPEKGTPAYAFGLTNRPDELVHLVIDVLERTKSTAPFRSKERRLT